MLGGHSHTPPFFFFPSCHANLTFFFFYIVYIVNSKDLAVLVSLISKFSYRGCHGLKYINYM